MEAFKKRMTLMEREVKKKSDEVERAVDQYYAQEKTNKLLMSEREKMKERIKKLKSRKGKFDAGSKICRGCGRDYLEKENFNWSCRTH